MKYKSVGQSGYSPRYKKYDELTFLLMFFLLNVKILRVLPTRPRHTLTTPPTLSIYLVGKIVKHMLTMPLTLSIIPSG